MERRTVSRRGVLGIALVAATAATAGFDGLLASVAGAATPAFPRLRQSEFQNLIGNVFRVRGSRIATSITLASVTPLAMTGLPHNRKLKTTGEQFSLLFDGPTSADFPQGTYTLSTPSLGNFGLFIVPVGQRSTRQEYQSIIVSV